MEINEMSSIPDLKRYAEEQGIDIPNNVRAKAAILKHIVNEMESSEATSEIIDEEVEEALEEETTESIEELTAQVETGVNQYERRTMFGIERWDAKTKTTTLISNG